MPRSVTEAGGRLGRPHDVGEQQGREDTVWCGAGDPPTHAGPLEHHAVFFADRPAVVSGWHVVEVAGPVLHLGAVFEKDRLTAIKHDADVVRLAPVSPTSG